MVADVTETIKSFESKGLLWLVADEAQLSSIEADHPSDSPLTALAVEGSSMFPVLVSGDKVLAKRSSLFRCYRDRTLRLSIELTSRLN